MIYIIFIFILVISFITGIFVDMYEIKKSNNTVKTKEEKVSSKTIIMPSIEISDMPKISPDIITNKQVISPVTQEYVNFQDDTNRVEYYDEPVIISNKVIEILR